ncbi:hypothetical protein J3459_018651 [Metarhizium acridum]|nr:hypothetical protein J3459_018651 [Metarhizium acridum]
MAQSVQCYYLPPNSDVPNSPLPVLHYRGVLPSDATEDMVTKFLTANTWEKRVRDREEGLMSYAMLALMNTCRPGRLGAYWHPPFPSKHARVLWYDCLEADRLVSKICHLILAGIVSGRSTMLLGKINDGTGVDVEVQRGDVIVLPAGTAHSSIESTPDYFYIGVYPRRHPWWVNEHGQNPATHFRSTIRAVEMPEEDPVYGKDGPLLKLWHPQSLAKL